MLGLEDGYLYAINPNGSLKWEYNTGNVIHSSPAVDNVRGVVYVGNNLGAIYAVDTSGGLKWQTNLSGAVRYSSPAVAYPNNMVYIGSIGYFYVIDGVTGNIICSNSHTNEVTSPAVDDTNNIYKMRCVWYLEYNGGLYKICHSVPTGDEEGYSCVKDRFQLYPNPFVTTTKIAFNLSVKAHILLEAYDISGKPVKKLIDEVMPAGSYSMDWDMRDASK